MVGVPAGPPCLLRRWPLDTHGVAVPWAATLRLSAGSVVDGLRHDFLPTHEFLLGSDEQSCIQALKGNR
jgi:hypothetical protein